MPSPARLPASAAVVPFPVRHDVDGRRWEPWVDEVAVARHYGVSARTVRRWRSAGMPSRLVGGARRYRLGDAEDWHAARAG